MYFGVYFGDLRGFVFCTGRRRSQIKVDSVRKQNMTLLTFGFPRQIWITHDCLKKGLSDWLWMWVLLARKADIAGRFAC